MFVDEQHSMSHGMRAWSSGVSRAVGREDITHSVLATACFMAHGIPAALLWATNGGTDRE